MALPGDPMLLVPDGIRIMREVFLDVISDGKRSVIVSSHLPSCKYARVEEDGAGCIRVYDPTAPEEIVTYLYEHGIPAAVCCSIFYAIMLLSYHKSFFQRGVQWK